jgi:2-methylcitrate dehydratase PrpD
MSVTQTRSGVLASFITTCPGVMIPDTIRTKARRHILDSLACGLAGACSSEAQRLRAMLAATEPAGPSPAWGTDRGLSPRSTARPPMPSNSTIPAAAIIPAP